MDLTFAILIWTVCAVAAWWIATVKHAPNPGTWAAIGLLFGPLGVLGAIADAKPARVWATTDGPQTAATTSRLSGLVQALLVVGIIGLLGVGAYIGLLNPTTQLPISTTVSPDVPPAGQVWFGQSFDPATFAISGRQTTVGANQPFSMVAHLTRTMDAAKLAIRAYFNDALVATAPVNATGSGDVFGFSPGPLYAAGSWRYDLVDVGGNVLASGSVTAQ
jgi:hypothetical protein